MIKKNLILSVIHNYDYPFVEPFIKSLQEVNYTGDLVIFASDTVSKATKRRLTANGAVLINYKSAYPFIEEYKEAFDNITQDVSINNYRFLLYLNFLSAHKENYAHVMVTDIRDVVFQKDPFEIAPGQKIFFFLEDPVQTFHHHFNFEWLTEATDIDTANRLIDQIVSCAGITIGGTVPMLNYLQYIQGKLKYRPKVAWGLDQGIHNSYVYITQPAEMQVFANDDAFVATLGAYQPYQLDSNGQVVNSTGKPYNIVHQYDRSGELFTLIKARYVGSRLTQRLKRLYYLLMP